MGWKDWFSVGGGESMTTKTTTNSDGSKKFESLRTNEGSKSDHQHTWVNRDSSGKITSGGATPGKSSDKK
jgi:hypothetical protein